jgi:putative SOS response-associated peptidase YedK
MSRLHTVMASAADVAAHFEAHKPDLLHIAPETTEGNPGLVVFENGSRRLLRSMTWGFPRWTREARLRGDGPERLGLVADLTNPMWEHLVSDNRYRCLIVLTHFANPDGDPGAKTRTWFSVKDQPIVAWAGFCRNTPEFGPVYAGMTMEANEAIPPTNDRMPVLLDPEDYDRWLHGSMEDVIRFQYGKPFAPDRMVIERSEDSWRSDGLPAGSAPQLALL